MFACSTAAVPRADAERRPAQKPATVSPAGTMGGLTDSLAALLRRPVAMATLTGQLLACSDPDADSTAGAGTNRPAHSFWHTALRQLNARRNGASDNGLGKTIRIISDDGGGGSSATQIVCPIRANDVPVASVFIWEGPVRLSPICVRHAEHTALAAGLYLEQRQKCLGLERGLGSLLLSELLNGRFRVDPTHTALAASINLSLDKEYRVATLNVHQSCLTPAGDTSSAAAWIEQLLAMLAENSAPGAVWSADSGATFLLPAQIDIPRFWSGLRRPGMSLVVGAPARGIEAIASSYVDVQSLCSDAEPGQLYMHGRLLLPSVLRGDRGAQQAFVDSIFGKLAKLRGGRSLIKSLATYARVGFHQARAAKALYIHPNTLRYRIDRISQALGLDLLDADVRFRIQLASHLWALNVEQDGTAEGNAARRRPT